MNPLAVIDVETTGLNPYRHDRVVEVAVVLLVPEDGIQAELTTLVNPGRDVGPTSIHGLTASDLFDAPRFADIAADLAELLRPSAALIGHNVRFDVSFLQSEYKRIGIDMPLYATFDTMVLAGGGSLSTCCAEHGISFDGATHHALHDARAAAHLLQKMLLQNPHLLGQCASCHSPVWPTFPPPYGRLLPRERIKSVTPAVPSYIQRLTERLSRGSADSSLPEGEVAYRGLLWRILEDGRVDESESESLVDLATNWGISFDRVNAIHLDYLLRLVRAAWADRHISDGERRELQLAARLLGFGTPTDEQLLDLLKLQETKPIVDTLSIPGEDWIGKTVCFTGECNCSIGGQIISRELAEQMAVSKGLEVRSAVTKKLEVLVVADPNTQSSKARQAQKYGIRIVHEPAFWRALGIVVD